MKIDNIARMGWERPCRDLQELSLAGRLGAALVPRAYPPCPLLRL